MRSDWLSKCKAAIDRRMAARKFRHPAVNSKTPRHDDGASAEDVSRNAIAYCATAAPLRVSTTLTPDFSSGVAPNLRRSSATSGRYRRGI